jgi:hypothetical protein
MDVYNGLTAYDNDNLDVLPDDGMDEFLDRVGSKAPQPKSAAQVRSLGHPT